MAENETNQTSAGDSPKKYRGPWGHIIRGMWRTPLGMFGVVITTISITLMIIGMIVEGLGVVHNAYVGIITYMVLPGGMIMGLIIIPIAAFLRRRQYHKYGIVKEHLQINLSDHKHRTFIIGFIILTIVNITVLVLVGYEGYHFTDSPYFCGMVCHKVMAPEYTAYQRSPHVKVACVECHIGPGAEWFVQAKISGLRQVLAVIADSYSRPIPAPVEHLRPARDTCEQCHWPDKFHGKKVKIFTHFTNDDQVNPEVNNIALHIGGHNPQNGEFEGIHWHVSKDVQVRYQALDRKRTQIAKVQVTHADGSQEEFVKEDLEAPADAAEGEWRTMDCIDCHNRPTHIYDWPEDVVDFGLVSKQLDPTIKGIREDSLIALQREYPSRAEAQERMPEHLIALQKLRDEKLAEKNIEVLRVAGAYLVKSYLNNVWPDMNVTWGTYPGHLGHRHFDDTGFGCWRCHDDEHVSESGNYIKQDCDLCHDEPE
ncbi:MAG: cytochrome c3 family protein [Desulfobulbales bacterium]